MTDAGGARFDFTGRRVWVTGASRGLGREIAVGFATAGARVAITARDAPALAALAAELRGAGADVIEVPASVADGEAVAACASAIDAEWGGLDVLVNCAGISPTFSRSETVTDEEWRAVLEVNATGSFLCAREAARLMLRDDGGGSIVNVSSIGGVAGLERLAGYSASKGAVDALTRTLAVEWAERGIRVNALAPGFFETDMTAGLRRSDRWRDALLSKVPMRRFGTPPEIVSAAMFLASDAAAFITGAHLAIDGGWTAA
ncbi:glucose 1-dehydrogenase [Protaetiibacter sp. SSC-01]|uniref:SDR family NAD(P)-dependent oxidoreductase n=1 Tax=Protaetiibacter sp. SSC-01 TaxID=2759943 RepID=UPI0016575B18|nr:glucose 1-dehydrogenase [Protaetiibacter sp. SSC-01]QNO38327.1 glucose 1-dehydrogenase [Protaetiibacter sp. SSC-01]